MIKGSFVLCCVCCRVRCCMCYTAPVSDIVAFFVSSVAPFHSPVFHVLYSFCVQCCTCSSVSLSSVAIVVLSVVYHGLQCTCILISLMMLHIPVQPVLLAVIHIACVAVFLCPVLHELLYLVFHTIYWCVQCYMYYCVQCCRVKCFNVPVSSVTRVVVLDLICPVLKCCFL